MEEIESVTPLDETRWRRKAKPIAGMPVLREVLVEETQDLEEEQEA